MILAASVYTFGPGRLGASAAALIALAGLVIGVVALVRHERSTRRGGLTALATGVLGVVLGGLVVVTADGGLGTGNGLGGGIVAMVLGLAGIGVGWRCLVKRG